MTTRAKRNTPTRRQTLLGLGALTGLAGCGGLPDLRGGGGGVGPAPAPDPAMQAVSNTGWDAWVAAFRDRAAGRGIPQSTLSAAFRDAGYLPVVIERDRNQTEFTRTLQDYLAIAANDERVSTGRAMFARHRDTLARIESTYGVEARVVTAVWGLESRYGDRMGDIPVISALSTLAYDGRRGSFFENQLMAALRILQNGDISAGRMTGSWAGAMGHTQFIPTSYEAYAVDFTGDGRRDIWSADPSDALASTAAYLQRSGWQRGQPWGAEVTLPADFPTGMLGRGTTRSPSDWAAMGVRRATGGSVPDHGPASIIRPQTPGPAFMVFRNFTVITRYNNAEKYVIGVGHLSDRIGGSAPLEAEFGPDRYGLTLQDRMALQRGLTRAGFDAGGADGVLGSKTEAAIRAYQRANGLAETGEPSRDLLRRVS